MALKLKLSYLQQNLCAELVLFDVTGEYDAVSNTTGWGTTANPGTNLVIDNSSITEARLLITKPDGTPVSIDLMVLANWQKLTPYATAANAFDAATLPSTLKYTLTETELGTIEDGVYQIRYTIGDGIDTYNETFTVALYGRIQTGLFQMTEAANQLNIDSKLTYTEFTDITVTWALYLQMIYSAQISNTTRFNKLLATLQRIMATYNYNSLS